jgi:hypothetical protein
MMEQWNAGMRLNDSDKYFIHSMLRMIVPNIYIELFWNTQAQFQAARPN